MNWESQTFNATSYIVFLFIFGLIVPVIVIVPSYVKIILTMRENSLRMGRLNKVEGRVTIMIFIMILGENINLKLQPFLMFLIIQLEIHYSAFLLAWTPYAIFALIEQFGDPELITPALAVLPALLAKSSICYNPMIYVGMNSQVLIFFLIKRPSENLWRFMRTIHEYRSSSYCVLFKVSGSLEANLWKGKA